jgi:hypothetical protein
VFYFGALGDWPYDAVLGTPTNVDKAINSINGSSQALAFLYQVGDIHSGSQPCTGAGLTDAEKANLTTLFGTNFVTDPTFNTKVYGYFNRINVPVIYAPGDNEWTDCHKTKQKSSGDPIREQAAVRAAAFPTPGVTMGLKKAKVTSQAKAYDKRYPADAEVVENVYFTHKGVLFATLSVPGGNNTFSWTTPFTNEPARQREFSRRTLANLRWIDTIFDKASSSSIKAVVIGQQADFWHLADFTGSDGPALIRTYAPYVQQIALRTNTLGKPVLLINGDRHGYSVDTPLANPGDAFGRVYNTDAVPLFQRLGLQASWNPASWTRVAVDTSKTGNSMFSFENVIFCRDKTAADSIYVSSSPSDAGFVAITQCSD